MIVSAQSILINIARYFYHQYFKESFIYRRADNEIFACTFRIDGISIDL